MTRFSRTLRLGTAFAALTVLSMGAALATDSLTDAVSTDVSTSTRQQSFALQLATADLKQQGIVKPTAAQLAVATSAVQAMRDKGMGWGAIANSLGLRLGAVVSAAKRADRAEEEAGQHPTKPHDTMTTAASERAETGVAKGRSSDGGSGGGGNGGGKGGGNAGGNGGSAGGGQSGGGNAGGGNAGGKGGGNAGGNGGGGNGGGNGGGHGKR